ncbi:MAG: hypothetical protein ACXWP6_09070, partial [Ktedonobacterales bacterium]
IHALQAIEPGPRASNSETIVGKLRMKAAGTANLSDGSSSTKSSVLTDASSSATSASAQQMPYGRDPGIARTWQMPVGAGWMPLAEVRPPGADRHVCGVLTLPYSINPKCSRTPNATPLATRPLPSKGRG